MSTLRVRAYNVLFGDAVLVSVPDEDDSGDPGIRRPREEPVLAKAGTGAQSAGLGRERSGSPPSRG